MREKALYCAFFACICYICCIEHECAARIPLQSKTAFGALPNTGTQRYFRVDGACLENGICRHRLLRNENHG